MMRTAKGGAAGRTGEEDTARRRLGRHLLPWVAPLGVLLMVLGLGCKGSSNSDTGNSVLPCTAISFTRSLASPGAGDVYLQAATSSRLARPGPLLPQEGVLAELQAYLARRIPDVTVSELR